MATIVTWLDVDGNVNNTANYDDGAVVVNGDSLYIPTSNKSVVTNPTTLTSVNLVDLRFGKAVTGTWGTEAAPIEFGACTGACDVDSPLAQLLSISFTSIPKLIIHDVGDMGNGGFFLEDGTITDMIIMGGGYIRLGADAGTITNLWVIGGLGTHPTPIVRIDAGATITNLYAERGVVNSYSANITNYELSGTALLRILGDSAIGSTKLEARGRSRVEVVAPGGTHAAITAYESAVVDMASNTRARTATAITASGNSMVLAGRHITNSTATVRGGRIEGLSTLVIDALPGSSQGSL